MVVTDRELASACSVNPLGAPGVSTRSATSARVHAQQGLSLGI